MKNETLDIVKVMEDGYKLGFQAGISMIVKLIDLNEQYLVDQNAHEAAKLENQRIKKIISQFIK